MLRFWYARARLGFAATLRWTLRLVLVGWVMALVWVGFSAVEMVLGTMIVGLFGVGVSSARRRVIGTNTSALGQTVFAAPCPECTRNCLASTALMEPCTCPCPNENHGKRPLEKKETPE